MKLLLKLCLNLVILLLFSYSLSAQNSIIRGQVTDENKVPLVSVTITVAGKNTTAITTINGEFSIDAGPRDKLKFSFVGMDNKTVDVNSRLYLNVVLKLKIENSDEVDLINVYTNKLNKFILQKEFDNQILDKIYNIVNTPLEGEMAKHNKIKVITCKLIKKNDELDVIFYVKYKDCKGYNKQFNNLIANVLDSIKQQNID
jgi:hypothetical protein